QAIAVDPFVAGFRPGLVEIAERRLLLFAVARVAVGGAEERARHAVRYFRSGDVGNGARFALPSSDPRRCNTLVAGREAVLEEGLTAVDKVELLRVGVSWRSAPSGRGRWSRPRRGNGGWRGRPPACN